MRGRRVGAIANYKAAVRAIKADRKRQAAKGQPVPAHLTSERPAITRGQDGLWRVWSVPLIGPPFKPAGLLAGPFDTRDEAEGWLDGTS